MKPALFQHYPRFCPRAPGAQENLSAKEPLSSTSFSFYRSFFLSILTPYGSWDIYSEWIDSFTEQTYDRTALGFVGNEVSKVGKSLLVWTDRKSIN